VESRDLDRLSPVAGLRQAMAHVEFDVDRGSRPVRAIDANGTVTIVAGSAGVLDAGRENFRMSERTLASGAVEGS
jgi:hypothetical protein